MITTMPYFVKTSSIPEVTWSSWSTSVLRPLLFHQKEKNNTQNSAPETPLDGGVFSTHHLLNRVSSSGLPVSLT